LPIAEKSGASDDEVAASPQTEGRPAEARADDVPRPPSGGRYDQVGTTFMLDATVANTIAPEPARRGPVGGATRIGEKFFIRVTMGPRQRVAERAPWAKSQAEAEARGRVVQSWVNRLRNAGLAGLTPKFVETGARASEATLRKIAARVDSLVKNDGTYRVEDVRSVGKAKEGDVVTFRNFAERWTDGELARLYPDHIEVKASVDDDVERFEKHIYPHVEDLPLVSFTREDADGVMAKLSPSLKRGTRRQIAQLINRVLHLAVFTGALKAHPLPRGWLPRAPKAETVAKESLLPSEEAKLLAGRNAAGETVVPLPFRMLYAFFHREGMRKGEAKALGWPEIDLKRGLVSLDENKTDRPRSWVLDSGVLRALVGWHEKLDKPTTGRVFDAIPQAAWEKLAPIYRGHCEAVGVDRARLFQKKENKLRLRAHDMRAFFVTAAMSAGKDALWITDRTGHTSLAMIRTYERDVRRWRELGETPVNVADAILEVAETSGELPAMKRPVKFKDHVEIKMASFFIFTRTD
jgi:integrase